MLSRTRRPTAEPHEENGAFALQLGIPRAVARFCMWRYSCQRLNFPYPAYPSPCHLSRCIQGNIKKAFFNVFVTSQRKRTPA